MNLILSGVETPERKEGDGGTREEVEWVGEGTVVKEDCVVGARREEDVWDREGCGREETEEPIVVLRWRLMVSVDGGGGRWFAIVWGERIEARQRKHSPVPK